MLPATLKGSPRSTLKVALCSTRVCRPNALPTASANSGSVHAVVRLKWPFRCAARYGEPPKISPATADAAPSPVTRCASRYAQKAFRKSDARIVTFIAVSGGRPSSSVAPANAFSAVCVWSVRSVPNGANKYGVEKKRSPDPSASRIHQKFQRKFALSLKPAPARCVPATVARGKLHASASAAIAPAAARCLSRRGLCVTGCRDYSVGQHGCCGGTASAPKATEEF